MYSNNFCILCLTETWLSDSIYDGEILPVGYVLYRKDRPSRGGGVQIAIRESLFSCLIPSPPELEVVCVKIGQSNNSIICCIYMPPESSLSYVSSVVHFLTELSSSFSKCIFVGDFNFPDIDWSALTGSSSQSICFCSLIFDCNLAQHVSEPTHVKGNMLNLVLTSPGVAVNHGTVHPHSVVYFSDHYAICFDLNCHTSTAHVSIHGYTFDFRCIINRFYIKSLLNEAMLLYIPRILIKRRQGPKWFDSDTSPPKVFENFEKKILNGNLPYRGKTGFSP